MIYIIVTISILILLAFIFPNKDRSYLNSDAYDAWLNLGNEEWKTKYIGNKKWRRK